MQLRRAGSLTAEEARELQSLVEAELNATRERAEAMIDVRSFEDEQNATLKSPPVDVQSPMELYEQLLKMEEEIQDLFAHLNAREMRILYMRVVDEMMSNEIAEFMDTVEAVLRFRLNLLYAKVSERSAELDQL